MNRCTGSAKTERNVPLVIRGDATHPAPGTVGLVGSLLAKRPVPWEPASQLEPTYACHRIRADRKVVKQRLATVGKSAIGVAEHQPVSEAVQRFVMPNWGTHLDISQLRLDAEAVKSAAGTLARGVKLELAGWFQST